MSAIASKHGRHIRYGHQARLLLLAKRSATEEAGPGQPNVPVETERYGIAHHSVGVNFRSGPAKVVDERVYQESNQRAQSDARLRERFRTTARRRGSSQTFRHALLLAEFECRRAHHHAPGSNCLLLPGRPPTRIQRSWPDSGHPGTLYRVAQTLRPLENGTRN